MYRFEYFVLHYYPMAGCSHVLLFLSLGLIVIKMFKDGSGMRLTNASHWWSLFNCKIGLWGKHIFLVTKLLSDPLSIVCVKIYWMGRSIDSQCKATICFNANFNSQGLLCKYTVIAFCKRKKEIALSATKPNQICSLNLHIQWSQILGWSLLSKKMVDPSVACCLRSYSQYYPVLTTAWFLSMWCPTWL